MADSSVKKLIIPKADLPPISAEDNSYYVRYRVISQEQLRRSQWSPVNVVPGNTAPAITQISVAVDAGNNTVTAVWSPPENYELDTVFVFVKWSDSAQPSLPYQFRYAAKVSNTTYAAVIPEVAYLDDETEYTPDTVTIAVQVPTYPRVRSAEATLFVSTPKSLVL